MGMNNRILCPTASGLFPVIDGGSPGVVNLRIIDGGTPSLSGPYWLDGGTP